MTIRRHILRSFWPWRNNPFLGIVLALVSAFSLQPSAFASDVTLAWNPSTSTNVIGYRIYAWTNTPDANCAASNTVQTVTVGPVTNATLTMLVSGNYTFGATALSSGSESPMSNLAYWFVPAPPTYLVTVQSSTNLINWSNTPVFFRLQISP
jgi:hypothetical protein